MALSDIAEVQAQFNQVEEARVIFEQALKVASKSREQSAVLSYIAVTQAQIGWFEDAYAVAERIADSQEQVTTWAAIATVLAKSERLEQAQRLLGKAFSERGQSMGVIARALAEIGQFEQACAVAEGIGGAGGRALTLASIAMWQARAGRGKDAQSTFALAMTTAWRIKDAEEQAKTLTGIAVTQAHAGQQEKSMGILAQAREAATQIRYEGERRRAFAHLKEAMVHMQLIAGQIAEAERLVAEIECEYGLIRARALTAIAEAKATVGEGKRAVPMMDAILRNRSESLYQVATALAEAGDKEHFKQLLLPCAHYLDAAYKMCGLLARLYPEQAGAVAEVVTR